MKKLVIFAEGGTEQAFAENLLTTIATEKHIQIEKTKIRGKVGSRHGSRISITAANADQKYFALICDCGSDESVKSDIVDRYESLCANGFNAIIGIRDVLGQFAIADVPRLKRLLYYGVKTQPVRPTMILAVMEIEAWFLAEHTHLPEFNAGLNLGHAIQVLGFDPSQQPELVETRLTPAADLHAIYQFVGERYTNENGRKIVETIKRTIDALDYSAIYLQLRDRIPALTPLIAAIDSFLT